ncbi:MAG: hypothetical protein ACI9FN_000381 [Saprospiraceae bacterium]|jgi:hypothetical protein
MNKKLHAIQIFLIATFLIFGAAFNTIEAGAKYLECGKNYWFGAPNESHYDNYNYNLTGCYTGSHDYKGADQMFYFDVNEYSDVTIDLSGFHEDMDLLVFKGFEAWGYGSKFTDCQGSSINHNKTAEKIYINNAYGRYYIMVEAYTWGWSSGFDLSIACHQKPQAVSCHDYPSLQCGQWETFNGHYDNAKVSNAIDNHPTCNSGWGNSTTDHKGPEMVYRIENGWGGLEHVTIDFHALKYGEEFDVFVYQWCESHWDPWTGKSALKFSGLVNPCDYNTHYGDHSIYVDHVGYGEDLYVVVEGKNSGWGWNQSLGDFQIAVTCGDVCDQSMDWMECGTKTHGSTKGRQNRASYYWQSNNSHSAHNWGPERTYKFKVDHMNDYEFDLRVKFHADLNMYIMNDCGAKECIASSTNYGRGQHENIKHRMNPGTYYVVIEGYHGDSGDYDLEISGCGCSDAKRLWCDTPVYGTTVGAENDVTNLRKDCFPNAGGVWLKGPDRTYSFKAPKAGYYEFTLSELQKDLDLYLMSECHEVNSCLGYSTKASDQNESIKIHLAKNEEIFALVDSRASGIKGSYLIEVVCNPQEPEEPEEPGTPTLSCFTASKEAGIITIDLTYAKLTVCDNAESSLTIVNLDSNGDPIDITQADMLITEGVATYDAGLNESGTDYRVCSTESCDDITKSCCQDFTFEGLLSCGVTVSGTTVDGQSEYASNDIELCYSSSSSFNGPDVLIPFVKATDEDVLQITLYQATSNLSLFILDADKNPTGEACKGSNFNSTKDMSNAGAVGEYWTEDLDNLLPAGRYYALIEGYASHIESDFSLSVSCGFDCSSAASISCGADLGEQSTVGGSNTQSAYDIAESTKVGYTGPENVYELQITETTDITIALSDISEGDLDLFLLSGDCASSTVMAQSITSDDADERITMSLDSGTYYVVVDGWKGGAATFNLSVEGCAESGLRDQIATARSLEISADEISVTHAAYPNPFSHQLNIEILASKSGTATLRMTSVDGKLIHSATRNINKGSNIFRVSENDLQSSSGIIYYEIKTDDTVIRGKALKIQ